MKVFALWNLGLDLATDLKLRLALIAAFNRFYLLVLVKGGCQLLEGSRSFHEFRDTVFDRLNESFEDGFSFDVDT